MADRVLYQAELLRNRLVKRYAHLSKWARRNGVGLWRLYDRDIPEIPLVLDFVTFTDGACAVSGALYKRPYEKDESLELEWLKAMRGGIARALNINCENIILKVRKRQRMHGQKNLQYQKSENYNLTSCPTNVKIKLHGTVTENNLLFRVFLHDYIDCGLFPHLRKARAWIMKNSCDKKVLNLFCYTASFSVYAAAGCARHIDSVDMSGAYLKHAAANLQLNNVDNKKCTLIRADVIRFLHDAAIKKLTYDIIILDPPSFSNSKKMIGNDFGGTLFIKRDYKKLLVQCLRLLNSRGFIFFSINMHGFSLDIETAELELTEELNCLQFADESKLENKKITIRNITKTFRDVDFIKKRMPLCYLISCI